MITMDRVRRGRASYSGTSVEQDIRPLNFIYNFGQKNGCEFKKVVGVVIREITVVERLYVAVQC